MFTGLIEEIGEISAIRKFNGGLEFDINADLVMSDLKIDDSIAINGACQTVIRLDDQQFTVQSIQETLEKTTFSSFKVGTAVNLERALRADSRLGGHFVQGHVNGVAGVKSIVDRGENRLIGISLPAELRKFCIKEGSIAIDGISLTIADLDQEQIFVSIIPHTMQATTIARLDLADQVNIEVDMLAKYVYQFNSKTNSEE
ncbi:MAG: riboflavin synthase [Calditrichaeota bacterium]|nr:riboflavin synthase [Calditrichota bacterium]